MKANQIRKLLIEIAEDFHGRSDIEEVILGPLSQQAIREVPRLIKWIERTANDTSGGSKAGYHARRIRLEAQAILRGADFI